MAKKKVVEDTQKQVLGYVETLSGMGRSGFEFLWSETEANMKQGATLWESQQAAARRTWERSFAAQKELWALNLKQMEGAMKMVQDFTPFPAS